MAVYEKGRAFAEAKDRLDPIAHLREHFYTKENQIYMDGNSLGLCSKDAEKAVLRALEQVRSGKLGRLLSAEAQMNCWHPNAKREWLGQYNGGMMFFLCCHLVDLVHLFMGDP